MELHMVIMTFGLIAIFGVKAEVCEMVGFYQELGCTPVPNPRTNTACPIAYDCPEYPDTTKCYYKGVAYSEGDSIPDSVIDHPCSLGCYCDKDSSGGMRFFCAAVDCFFFTPNQNNETCINTRELGSCCGTGTVCGEENIAKLKTCEVDGTTYREGQAFYPKNTNKMCICTAEWDGCIEDPRYCEDLNCGLEIYYRRFLTDRCAIGYISSRRNSCPFTFICPSSTTRIVRQTTGCKGGKRGRNPPQCLFGNSTLHIGDRVLVDDKCMTCSCEVPPYVRCIRDANC